MRPRPIFTVQPSSELAGRARLFAALEDALGVAFRPAAEHAHGRIGFGLEPDTGWPAGLPVLVFPDAHAIAAPRPGTIVLSRSDDLPPPLRGATLLENTEPVLDRLPTEPTTVFATCDGTVVWSRSRHGAAFTDVSRVPLGECRDGGTLRDLFTAGNALALLTLVHFIRSVLGPRAFSPPSLRATIILDDLNLRSFSYGFVDYPNLLRLAEEHNFHVVLATIPLDMWWASHDVIDFAKRNARRLSLAIHGNDHLRAELNRRMSHQTQLRLGAQALRRVARFERQHGLDVSRVIIPPHGMCSRGMIGALRAVGFKAVCVSRPAPWIPHREPPVIVDGNRLQRWSPADFVDGMPILHRQQDSRDFPLDAYLGQPLIAYYHHDDFADGYDPLLEIAAEINRLGDVRWLSLEAIARSNFEAREEGSDLRIHPFSRSVDVRIPAGIRRAIVELPASGTSFPDTVVVAADVQVEAVHDDESSGPTAVIPVGSATNVTFDLHDGEACDPAALTDPPLSPRPIVRRLLTESRDRFMPIARRVRR